MKLIVAFLSCAIAWPIHKEFHTFHQSLNKDTDWTDPLPFHEFNFKTYPFKPPGAGDVRSPCPWLSICANHGIIHRSGKDIHFEELFRCAEFGGFGKTMFRTSRRAVAPAAKVLRKKDKVEGRLPKDQWHPVDRLSLDETGMNGPIEHDLSIVRYDVDRRAQNLDVDRRALNKDAPPSPELVKALLQIAARKPGCTQKITDEWFNSLECQPVDSKCYLDSEDLGAWHQDRTAKEMIRHQQLGRPIYFPTRDLLASAGEAVFLIHLMGRDGRISMEHARSFLLHEKIPCDWTRPPTLHFVDFLVPKLIPMVHSYRHDRGLNYKQLLKMDSTQLSKDEMYKIICDGDATECPPLV